MAFAPIVGAVAGAVGTVSAISSQNRQARVQREALLEQEESQTKQFELLNRQRAFQKDIAIAEQGRLRQEVAMGEQARLFNIRLQELSTNRASIMAEFQQAQEMFQIEQQRLVESASAAQEQGRVSQELEQASRQTEAQMAQAAREDVAGATQAARGQTESLSTAGMVEGQSLQQGISMAEFQQLFELNMATAQQNRDITERMVSLQQTLSQTESEARKTMADQDVALARTQLEFARDNALLESQMTRAALDAEASSRLFQLEAAQSTDQVSYASAMRQNQLAQRDVRASGPSLFSALPSLVGAGMTVYNAVSPPSVAPRVTNPLAQPVTPVDYSRGVASNAQSRQATQSFDYRRGVITDRTNALFNLG
jgi:hypothetical protein